MIRDDTEYSSSSSPSISASLLQRYSRWCPHGARHDSDDRAPCLGLLVPDARATSHEKATEDAWGRITKRFGRRTLSLRVLSKITSRNYLSWGKRGNSSAGKVYRKWSTFFPCLVNASQNIHGDFQSRGCLRLFHQLLGNVDSALASTVNVRKQSNECNKCGAYKT